MSAEQNTPSFGHAHTVAYYLQDAGWQEINQRMRGYFMFPPNYPGFQGHFPGTPILPIGTQIAMVTCLAATVLEQDIRLQTIKQVNFQHIAGPTDRLQLDIQPQQQGKTVILAFKMVNQMGIVAEGSLCCACRP